jgi:hypothetical protein
MSCLEALDEGYNFVLNLITIRGFAYEVMSPQSCESLGTKSHLDVAPMERCRVYYKGEGGGFPQV